MQPKPKALTRALTGLCLCLPALAFAVPMQLNHQGRLVDSSGIGLDGTGHTLTFAVHDDATGGSALWSETLSVTFTNGFYSAILGADEVSNPLDTTLFSSYPIYLEVTVNTDPPLSPRQELVSVPYAMLAETATNVDGGSVNANDVAINSMPVINDMGEWVGATPDIGWTDLAGVPADFADDVDDDSLAGLNCQDGEHPVYDTGAGVWTCGDFTDTTLSEQQVDSFVDNNDYVTSSELATVATSGDYFDLSNLPSDADTLGAMSCSDGEVAKYNIGVALWLCQDDIDTTLSESEVDYYVDNNGYLTSADVSIVGLSGEFSDLLNVPPDSDTLTALGCLSGEYPMWDGAMWTCVVPPDTQLTESEVDSYVSNNNYSIGAHTTDTTLDEAAVDNYVSNNGYSTGAHNVYSAGTGLGLAGNSFSADFGGDGSSAKVSRSDHSHTSYTSRKQVDDAVETTYEVSNERYHMSIGYNPYYKATKRIPQDIIEDYCSDEDGCEVIIAMRNYTSNVNQGMVASYDFHFFYDALTLRWRVTDGRGGAGNQDRDNNGSTVHAINAWSACYFTDSVYIGGSNQNDNEKGMHLLYWTDYVNSQNKRCEITFED